MQGVWVQTLVWELRSYMPRGRKNQNVKKKKRRDSVTNSIKNLKMVHVKKKKKRWGAQKEQRVGVEMFNS